MGNVRRFPALSEKWRANGKCGNCLSGVGLYNSASTDRRGKGRVRATRVCVYVLVRFTGSLTSWYTGGKKNDTPYVSFVWPYFRAELADI